MKVHLRDHPYASPLRLPSHPIIISLVAIYNNVHTPLRTVNVISLSRVIDRYRPVQKSACISSTGVYVSFLVQHFPPCPRISYPTASTIISIMFIGYTCKVCHRAGVQSAKQVWVVGKQGTEHHRRRHRRTVRSNIWIPNPEKNISET